ncbi:MAG: hypothetical protein HYZ47_00345 [Simkania negevensis]|nr:hypothetical protein [Simkania negevensis]
MPSYKHLCDWQEKHHKGGDGVLTGCDFNQEWMLKWWWEHYKKTNQLPVTFIDFGMSKSAQIWCKKQGDLISLSPPKLIPAPKEKIAPDLAQLWETTYFGDLWTARKGWFSKPFAFLKTPYDRTIWIDLDCQVLQEIETLLPYTEKGEGFAIALEVERAVKLVEQKRLLSPNQPLYNSGVLSFKWKSPVIKKWAENAYYQSDRFLGDQEVLSQTLFEEKFKIATLPPKYNWRPQDGISPETVILHFVCQAGKDYIRSHLI